MFGFCYNVFTEYMEKLCSIIPIYFHLVTVKRIARLYISTSKANMAKKNLGLEFRRKNR